MKRYATYIGLAVPALLFGLLVVFRGDLLDYLSANRAARMSEDIRTAVADEISRAYAYSRNGAPYTCTFLEFGATGCSACRQMETVMETIRTRYPDRVQVVFVHVGRKEHQQLVDYFGIATIPTQVLLDRDGKEYYRHTGYLSADELIPHLR